MKSNFNHKIDLELRCVELIENELARFFNACNKSAYAYSLMVAQNLKSHSKANFEKMVINEAELLMLWDDIHSKLNNYLNQKQEFKDQFISLTILDDTISQCKTTYNMTFLSEKIIDKTLSKCFNLFLPDSLPSKFNLGSFVLGKNNSKNQIKKNEEAFFKQVEGLLMNLRIDLRNLLLRNVVEQLNDDLYTSVIA